MVMSPLSSVLSQIDDANAKDPSQNVTSEGSEPAALAYGRRMSETLKDFAPDASEDLEIAVRGQHIERWLRPRSDYPEGREGYLHWRRDAAKFHAARVGAIMASAGYEARKIDHVSSLIMKKNLKSDPEAQTLENVACLVFLRWYANGFSETREEAKILAVVTKTARKMSNAGRAAALKLGLPQRVADAISAAS